MELLYVLLWYLTLQAVGLAALPAVSHVFRDLPDRGVALSKIAGWLLLSVAIWLAGMLGFVQFTRATVAFGLVAMGAIIWRQYGAELRQQLRGQRLWLLSEALFAGAFVVAVWVRAHTPDISGQEKFMDFAIMQSFLAHDHLPAPDPWLAGFGMPYYHLAYYMFALLAKLSGVPGPIAYNLAVATVASLTMTAAFVIVFNVVRLAYPATRWVAGVTGVLGGLFVTVLGNLEAVLEMLSIRGFGSDEFWATVGVKGLKGGQAAMGWLPAEGGWWWRASRIVPTTKPDGINEFPFFSFLLGDLHPHYMALPLDLLILALGLVVLLRPALLAHWWWRGLAVVSLASLVPANTWDVPVLWGLFGLLCLLGFYRSGTVATGIRSLALVGGLTVLLVLPYFVGYSSQPLGLGIVDERTPEPSFFIIFGSFILLTALWLIIGHIPPRLPEVTEHRMARFVLYAIVFGGIAVSLLGARTLGIALVLMALCAHRALADFEQFRAGLRPAPAETLAGIMLALGFAVIAGTELIFIRDSFGTRMNTVFKFHYNAWLLLALGTAIGVAGLLASRSYVRRVMAGLAACLVLFLGGVYPVAATATKVGQHLVPPTLDGAAFARRLWPNDMQALEWLRGARSARSVIVEGVGGDYSHFGRVSTFGGVPTPIGWIGHELQWRGPSDEYQRRERMVQDLYQSRDRDGAERIMDALGATYVFVGQLEREKYGADVGDRLKAWLPIAVQRGDALVLQRNTVGAR